MVTNRLLNSELNFISFRREAVAEHIEWLGSLSAVCPLMHVLDPTKWDSSLAVGAALRSAMKKIF